MHAPESAKRQDLGRRRVLVALEELLARFFIREVFLVILILPYLQKHALDGRGRDNRRRAALQHASKVKIGPVAGPLPHRKRVDPSGVGVVRRVNESPSGPDVRWSGGPATGVRWSEVGQHACTVERTRDSSR